MKGILTTYNEKGHVKQRSIEFKYFRKAKQIDMVGITKQAAEFREKLNMTGENWGKIYLDLPSSIK